jgi:hypothetical protein
VLLVSIQITACATLRAPLVMDTTHVIQHVLFVGAIASAATFIVSAGYMLLRLEPLDLRNPNIYFACLFVGLFYGLLNQFGNLIPHRWIVLPLFTFVWLAGTAVYRSYR